MKRNIMMVRYTKRALLSLLVGMICWNLHAQLERENVQVIMDRFDLLVVKTGDMDGDGDEDVVATCNAWDGHIAVFENLDGQGDLAWPQLYGDSIWAVNRNFQGEFELVDMDQDGDLDIFMLAAYQTDPSLELKLQVLDWIGDWYSLLVSSFLEVEWDKFAYFDCDMSVIDIDANGFPDAVYTHTGNGFADREYMVYLQVDPFTGGANWVWQSDGQPFVSHVVADIDQDDDEDLLAYYTGSGYYRVTYDNGLLNSSPMLLDTVLTGCSLSVGDLNGDGPADLLTYGRDNAFSFGSEHIFNRPGPLVSNPSPPFLLTRATNFLRDIQPWDWDSDGQADVFFCDDTGIAWLHNEGGGQSYSPPATVWVAPFLLSHFEFAQLDGDGLPDGVGATQVSNIGQLPVIWQSSGDPLTFPEFELRHGWDFDVADADQDVALLPRLLRFCPMTTGSLARLIPCCKAPGPTLSISPYRQRFPARSWNWIWC